MIPQRLVMSAFGSYAGREEIDFSQAGPGIFLVTGDTGAGKTTIFDAITYALYDQTSGGRRDGRMMRSQYAAEDTPTFVEFSFQYKGQDYRIMRSPEYERASKRRGKDGERKRTLERSAVTLFLPDGTEYPGKKAETNRKIVEIIGLDAGQFTQTVMIAQGEFLKLLSARSDERKEIFSRIFQTDLYARMQQRLREEAGALGGQMKDMERQEDQEMARLFCPEEESLLGRLESAALPEERLEAVRLILQYGKSREEAAKRQIGELDKELEKVNRDLAVAQELNRRFDYLEEARKGRAALLENASAVEERQRRLERSREARLVCETFKKREEAGRQKALLEKEIRETAEKIRQAGQQKKELVKNQEAALLEMHPSDAGAREIHDGDPVQVVSSCGSISAVAELVAIGMLCISHRRAIACTSGSYCALDIGSRKNSSISTSPQAIMAAICSAPPRPPGYRQRTGRPVASRTTLPVTLVATSSFSDRIRT